MARKKFSSSDQLDIFDDRTFEVVDNKHTDITPEEDFKERLNNLLKILELNSELIQEKEWLQDIYYLVDKNLKREKFEARFYILDIVKKCLEENSLIYIDTGLGKTYIAILLSILMLRSFGDKKILFLAPTRVLCKQHCDKINNICIDVKAGLITGATSKKQRLQVWNDNNIVVATPQTIVSELKKLREDYNVANANDIILINIDEVHKLTGKYAYKELVEFYKDFDVNNQIRFVGFTASPDSKVDKLEELRKSFKIAYTGIIAKCYDSDDVAPYVFAKKVTSVFIKRDLSILEENLKYQLSRATDLIIRKMISISKSPGIDQCEFYTILEEIFYKDDNGLIAGIKIDKFKELDEALRQYCKDSPGDQRTYMLQKNWGVLGLFNASFTSLKKGVGEFRSFLQRKYDEYQLTKQKLGSEKKINSKKKIKRKPSLSEFIENADIKRSILMLSWHNLWQEDLLECVSEDELNWDEIYKDPKLQKIEYLINHHKNGQIIIFTPYRDTLKKVVRYIRENCSDRKVEGFFGQSHKLKDRGMNQKEQERVLSDFRSGKIDILVSTSVGEEGLDFPQVDVVILFEPVSDVRRCIQMMGRTGRVRDGEVFILIYDGDKSETTKYYIFKNRKKIVEGHIANYKKFAQGLK